MRLRCRRDRTLKVAAALDCDGRGFMPQRAEQRVLVQTSQDADDLNVDIVAARNQTRTWLKRSKAVMMQP